MCNFHWNLVNLLVNTQQTFQSIWNEKTQNKTYKDTDWSDQKCINFDKNLTLTSKTKAHSCYSKQPDGYAYEFVTRVANGCEKHFWSCLEPWQKLQEKYYLTKVFILIFQNSNHFVVATSCLSSLQNCDPFLTCKQIENFRVEFNFEIEFFQYQAASPTAARLSIREVSRRSAQQPEVK